MSIIETAGPTGLNRAYRKTQVITADRANPVTITVPDTGDNVGLLINQNDATNNPAALTINNTADSSSLLFNPTLTDPTAHHRVVSIQDDITLTANNSFAIQHFYPQMTYDDAFDLGAVESYVQEFINSGAGTVASVGLGSSAISNTSTGTITDGYGLYLYHSNDGAGTFSEYYGIELDTGTAASTVNTFKLNGAFQENTDRATPVLSSGNQRYLPLGTYNDGLSFEGNTTLYFWSEGGTSADIDLYAEGAISMEAEDGVFEIRASDDKIQLIGRATGNAVTTAAIEGSATLDPGINHTGTLYGFYNATGASGAWDVNNIVGIHSEMSNNFGAVNKYTAIRSQIQYGGTGTVAESIGIETNIIMGSVTDNFGFRMNVGGTAPTNSWLLDYDTEYATPAGDALKVTPDGGTTTKYIPLTTTAGGETWDDVVHNGSTVTITNTENIEPKIVQNDTTNNPNALILETAINTGTNIFSINNAVQSQDILRITANGTNTDIKSKTSAPNMDLEYTGIAATQSAYYNTGNFSTTFGQDWWGDDNLNYILAGGDNYEVGFWASANDDIAIGKVQSTDGTTVTQSALFWDSSERLLGVDEVSPSAQLHLGTKALSADPTQNGAYLRVDGSTLTDDTTAASGTNNYASINSIGQPTLAATNTDVSTTLAQTLHVHGAPEAGTNQSVAIALGLTVGLYTGHTSAADTVMASAFILPGISDGVGDTTDLLGFNVLPPPGLDVTMGDTAGTTDRVATAVLESGTFSATAARTVTDAYTLHIPNAPVAGTNVTFTNTPLSLYVEGGASRFDGAFDIRGGFTDANKSGSTYAGQLNLSDASSEWDDFETNFGEVSILNAINQAVTDFPSSDYASVYDTTTQTVAVAGTFQAVTLSTNGPLSGITHTAGLADVTLPTAGTYKFDYSVTVQKTGGANSLAEIRLTDDGTEIPGSSVTRIVNLNNAPGVMNGTVMATVGAGSNINLQFTGDTTTTQIVAPAGVSTADTSVRLTITQIA